VPAPPGPRVGRIVRRSGVDVVQRGPRRRRSSPPVEVERRRPRGGGRSFRSLGRCRRGRMTCVGGAAGPPEGATAALGERAQAHPPRRQPSPRCFFAHQAGDDRFRERIVLEGTAPRSRTGRPAKPRLAVMTFGAGNCIPAPRSAPVDVADGDRRHLRALERPAGSWLRGRSPSRFGQAPSRPSPGRCSAWGSGAIIEKSRPTSPRSGSTPQTLAAAAELAAVVRTCKSG